MPATKPIPEGYHTLTPYLVVEGAAAAIAFYQKAFGATVRVRMNKPDGRIGHAEIQIGDSMMMLADENPEIGAFGPGHYGGASVSFVTYVADCDALYRRALAAGATSEREPADQPYGDRMAGVRDSFGYTWWLATHIKDVPADELAKMG